MKITFIGVGEACDPLQPNTSILLECTHDSSCQFMLDCGFTTPHQYFKNNANGDKLDALWISHFHGDHFFGVPLLLLRFWEMGRRKPLIITGQEGIQKKISQAMELAYPGFLKKIHYDIDFYELEAGMKKEIGGFTCQAAENEHSLKSMSLRLEKDGSSIFYSGDGKPTPASEKIANACSLIIHEAFWIDDDVHGHSSVKESIDFAKRVSAAKLALVHISNRNRKDYSAEINSLLAQEEKVAVFMPESGFVLNL